MATTSDLRIGHAEREATVGSLREHYAQGRLSIEEFNQRMDAAFAAKTQADLARITADLPHTGPGSAYRRSGRALAGSRWAAGHRGSWQDGSWRGASTQGGPRQRRSGRTRPSLLSAITAVIVIALAVVVIVSLFMPMALFGFWATKPLLILVAVFTLGRRIIRRFFGGPPVRTRRRGRWPA